MKLSSRDILETIIILAIVIILGYSLYKYLGYVNLETFTTKSSDAIFDLSKNGTFQIPAIWTNYLKNVSTQTQSPISIWVPMLTNTSIQRILGFSVLSGKYDNITSNPAIITINNPDYVKTPIQFNKIFETGMPLNNSSFNSNIYDSIGYTNFISGTNPNYKTDIPLQYSKTVNGSNIIINYVYNPVDKNSQAIMTLDFSNTSISQLKNEIEAVENAYNSYNKNNEQLLKQYIINYFSNGNVVSFTNNSVVNLNGNAELNYNNAKTLPYIVRQTKIPFNFNNPSYTDSIIIKKLNDTTETILNNTAIISNLNGMFNNPSISFNPAQFIITIPLGLNVILYDSWNYGANTFGNILYNYGLPIGTTSTDFDNYWQNLGIPSNLMSFDGLFLTVIVNNASRIGAIQIQLMASTFTFLQNSDPKLAQNNALNTYLNSLKSQLTAMTNFQTSVSNGTVDYPAFSCWAPIPPENYMSVGHLIINNIGLQQLDIDTQYANQIACIPTHCYRKVREWVASDIIFKYEKASSYFAIYLNPYTNTFIGTTNKTGPDGYFAFPGKIIPCPKKDYSIENIIGFDKNIRSNCKSFKSIEQKTPLVSSDANSSEDSYLQNKLYSQTQKIEALKAYANSIAMDNMKGRTINQEYNRAQLQAYIDNQRDEIDKAIRLLEEGRNRVDINVNYKRDAVAQIVNIIANSKTIPPPIQVQLIQKLQNITGTDMKAQVISTLATCPQFDLSGYIKKDPPCFGCSIPSS